MPAPPLGVNLTADEQEVVAWLSQRNMLPSPELVERVVAHPNGLGWLEQSLLALDSPQLFLGLGDLIPEPEEPTPEGYAERVKGRMDLGLTFIKFDIRMPRYDNRGEYLIGTPTQHQYGGIRSRHGAPGAGQGTKLTDAGIQRMADVVAAVREAVGWEISLCTDHFGHGMMTAKEVIRLANAVEPYGLAWLEDPMPWWDVDGHKRVTDAVNVPIAAGEELYLWDGFREWIEKRAIDILHPDRQPHRALRDAEAAVEVAQQVRLLVELRQPLGVAAQQAPLADKLRLFVIFLNKLFCVRAAY